LAEGGVCKGGKLQVRFFWAGGEVKSPLRAEKGDYLIVGWRKNGMIKI